MSPATRPPLPSSARLKKDLFEDSDERLFFISEFISGEEPTHPMPWELEEQRPELGPILVRTEEQQNWREPPRIIGEVLFLRENEVDAKSEAAMAWAQTTGARDICPVVVSYRLDTDDADFRSLQLLPLLELADQAEPGARFSYDGTAYPLPFSRAIAFKASGSFDIVDILDGDEGELWFEVRNVDDGEHLFITGVLLMTATFADARAGRV